MITLAKYYGGSRLYGLHNENSDLDERKIVLNTEPSKILGLEKFDQNTTQTKDKDKVQYELRFFMSLAKKCNPNILECLWCDDSDFIYLHPNFKEIRSHKESFINSGLFYTRLRGFIRSQENDLCDTKQNRLEGSDRDLNIKQYGYCPKKAYHIFRLTEFGETYFQTGNIKVKPETSRQLCLDLKNKVNLPSKDEILNMVDKASESLEYSYDNRILESNRSFDDALANDLLFKNYYLLVLKDYSYNFEDIKNQELLEHYLNV